MKHFVRRNTRGFNNMVASHIKFYNSLISNIFDGYLLEITSINITLLR